MNSKQRKTFEKILEKPNRSDVTWNEVKSLLITCGAEIKEGKGSRIRIVLNKHVLNIHSPHPQKEMKKYSVGLIREFLEKTGVNQNE